MASNQFLSLDINKAWNQSKSKFIYKEEAEELKKSFSAQERKSKMYNA